MLPNGSFKTFRFQDNGVVVDDGKASVMAAVVQAGGSDFVVQFSNGVQKFIFDPKQSREQSHLIDFLADGNPFNPFTCLIFNKTGYGSEPSITQGLENLPGQWQCPGEFGPIVIDPLGRFARTSVQGLIVLNARTNNMAEIKMHLLGDLRSTMWAGSVTTVNLDATSISKGFIRINGQDCKRV